jgi:nucleoside 2-deoxyribosyltransferase
VDNFPSGVLLDPILIEPCEEGKLAEKCVYLAGPFFDMGQRWVIEQARSALQNQGLKVFSPLHDVGRGKGHDVAPKDLAGLHHSKTLFAIVNGLDSGTVFEIGYARALGIPTIVLAQNVKEEDLKMLEGSGCEVVDDFVTGIYKTSWAYLTS